MRRWKWIAGAGACAAAAGLLWFGCFNPRQETGARIIAQRYLDALCRRDWAQAYAMLAPEARGRLTLDQFSHRAGDDRRRLGFDVESAFVHSCPEVGDKATASAAFGGHAGRREVTKNTTVTLRRCADGWAIALPAAVMTRAVVSRSARHL